MCSHVVSQLWVFHQLSLLRSWHRLYILGRLVLPAPSKYLNFGELIREASLMIDFEHGWQALTSKLQSDVKQLTQRALQSYSQI